MYFDSFSAALAMDGHGIYVWSAYFIATTAIALMLTLPKRKERKVLAQLTGELRRQQAHSQSPTGNT